MERSFTNDLAPSDEIAAVGMAENSGGISADSRKLGNVD